MLSGSAPMQPVTMTLPFSFSALADGGKQLRLGAVEKAAGVDDDEIGAGVLARKLVALRAQPRDDALAIDQRLRAAERDETHFRGAKFWVGIAHIRQQLTANAGQRKAGGASGSAKPRLAHKTSFPRPYGCPSPRG